MRRSSRHLTPETRAALREALTRLPPYAAAAEVGCGSKTARAERARMVRAGLTVAPMRKRIVDLPPAPEGFEVVRLTTQYDRHGKVKGNSVQSRREHGEVYEVPEAHEVKGESALIDARGRVIAKWVKTRAGPPDWASILLDAFGDHEAPSLPEPTATAGNLLTVYPVPDLHIGMQSWGRETGESYDLRIASDTARAAVADLVSQAPPSHTAVLLGLGDYYHQNDQTNVTPRGKHQLDVDGRWPKVLRFGVDLALDLVSLALQKHSQVIVKFLPGNHDPDAATG